MENIAETEPTHPHSHFTHFAALWFGEGPLPRGRERFANRAKAEKEARVIIGRQEADGLRADGSWQDAGDVSAGRS